MGGMKVNVAIPVYQPDKKLFISLKRLFLQSVRPERVYLYLTVTGKYGEKKLYADLHDRGLLPKYPIEIKTLLPEEFNHGGTRQAAAEQCDSEYVLFMTQDAVPKDAFLIEELLQGFGEEQKTGSSVAVCYGRQLANNNAMLCEQFSRLYNYPGISHVKTPDDLRSGSIKAIFCSDVCAMYDKNIFRSLDGFERDVDFNEDMLYAYKALDNDYAVKYVSGARVYHSHNLSLREQFWRNFEIAKSQKQHPEVFKSLKSEGEGLRYVKEGMNYISEKGNIFEAIHFVFYCGIRYLGFLCGKLFG